MSDPDELPRGLDRLAEAFSVLGLTPPQVEHDAVFTVAQSQHVTGSIPGLHTKNLFLKDKKGGLFLFTAPDDAEIDLKTIHTVLGARGRVSFGSAELMAETLGIAPGSVTPLAVINDGDHRVTSALHEDVANAGLVNVHPLRNTATVTLTREDLMRFLRHTGHEPVIVNLEQ